MLIHFVLPQKFTRAEIEWHVDELALKFQRTRDKKLIAQISALHRLLAKMDLPASESPSPQTVSSRPTVPPNMKNSQSKQY